jgi:hypothetical protein
MPQRIITFLEAPLNCLSKFFAIALLAAGTSLLAQGQAQVPNQPQAQPQPQSKIDADKGVTGFESFQGTINSDSRIFKLDSNLGWDFNKHFGVFAGVPVYFANVPASTTTTGTTTTSSPSTTNNGLGNAYMGFVFRAPNPKLFYATAVTASAPTGSVSKGFSTGRAGVDWTNRFEHAFSRLTPFFEGGLSNTVPDTAFLTRPFTSLGGISHLEEGAEYKLFKKVYAGGSGYQIVPFGTQKVFSKLDGQGKGKNPFDNATETTGADLTRENGFNTWVAFEPASIWRVELGYTRSMTFDLNSLAFNLRMNVGKLLRSRRSY